MVVGILGQDGLYAEDRLARPLPSGGGFSFDLLDQVGYAPALLLCLCLASCAPSSPSHEPPPDAGQTPLHAGAQALSACAERRALTLPTIESVIDLTNTLPFPVSVPCLLASLPRPLPLVATNSINSAQPAEGNRSPRVFLLLEHLAISVVPEGRGAPLGAEDHDQPIVTDVPRERPGVRGCLRVLPGVRSGAATDGSLCSLDTVPPSGGRGRGSGSRWSSMMRIPEP